MLKPKKSQKKQPKWEDRKNTKTNEQNELYQIFQREKIEMVISTHTASESTVNDAFYCIFSVK